MIKKIFRAAFVLFGLLTSSASAQLIISEYVDANTSRGAIELWNISGTNVTFGTGGGQLNVRVEIFANGSAAPTATLVLTPGFVLPAGNVFVLGHSLAPFAPICDQVAGAVAWTGNDAIVVRLASGTVLDSLGQVGVDPITEWGTGDISTADNTLRRIIGNTLADTNPANSYDPALYFTGHPLNNTDDLTLPPLANSLPSVGTYFPASVSTNSATLYGEINSHNTSTAMWFDYGTSTNYGASTPLQVAGSGVHGYQYVLTGLVSGVTYHYRAAASNSLGVVFGTNISFTTPVPAASAVTLPASGLWTNAATLNGSANPQGVPGLAWFVWASQPPLSITTPPQPIGSGTVATTFSATLTGLASGTLYYYQAVASNGAGVVSGTIHSFVTVSPPRVVTLPASSIGATNATLHGEANPNGFPTHGWFEWGLSTNYGNVTALQSLSSGTNPVSFQQFINLPGGGIVYHYRAVLSNAVGIAYGTNGSVLAPAFVLAFTNFPSVSGPAKWFDYNNDGRLDIALGGRDGSFNSYFQIWENTGTGFLNRTNLQLEAHGQSQSFVVRDIVTRDYDHDGWLDLFVNATAPFLNSEQAYTQVPSPWIWRNPNGTPGAPPSIMDDRHITSLDWGDYDNDGRDDLILATATSSFISVSPPLQLWRNEGTRFRRFDEFGSSAADEVDWIDFDSDGRLDLVTCDSLAFELWRNTGSGFVRTNVGLPRLRGLAVPGDYNHDGRIDLLISGMSTNLEFVVDVWRNTGSGFTNMNAGLPSSINGAALGDFDNDGRIDLAFSGFPGQPGTHIWRNSGSGFVTANEVLPGAAGRKADWGDYDNDGRLDLIVTSPFQVWRNMAITTNTPPGMPGGLTAAISNDAIILSWTAATDAQTPSAALSYNLRIGTAPGQGNVVPGARMPAVGNAGPRLIRILRTLPLGQPLYWSVQAVDTSFAASPFASEQAFGLNVTPPGGGGGSVPGDANSDGIVDEAELSSVLANYWPNSPLLQMTNMAGLGGTNVSFTLSNATTGAFSVESSTNLLDWNFLGPAIPRYEFFDTNAPTGPQRYYRLRWP